jgi:methionyl-tRNA formyltransferase
MLKKQDGRVDWALPARDIRNRVRGLRPWPGAFTTFRGKILHLWAAGCDRQSESAPLPPGALLAEKGRLLVGCGAATRLEPLELQMEGRKRLAARDFLNGLKLEPGEKFT